MEPLLACVELNNIGFLDKVNAVVVAASVDAFLFAAFDDVAAKIYPQALKGPKRSCFGKPLSVYR